MKKMLDALKKLKEANQTKKSIPIKVKPKIEQGDYLEIKTPATPTKNYIIY